MKTGFHLLLGGCCAPLILAAPASAAFTGLSTESRPNALGIFVVGVYAEFDQPGDQLLAIVGTPLSPLSISVIDGTFHQHVMGTDRAPVDALVAISPSLAYDTFVTIGVNLFDPEGDDGGQPEDFTFMTPTWPGFGPSSLNTVAAGWLVIPGARQGNPFDGDFEAGDGRVLIGQFATTDGAGFEGTMLVQSMSLGAPTETVASFKHLIPAPGAWMPLGLAGLCGRRRRR